MTRLTHTRAEVAMLPDRILACLKKEPMWTVDELANKMGFATAGVRKVLLNLESRGLVHFSQSRTHGGLGIRNYWSYGPAPKGVKLLLDRSSTLSAKKKRESIAADADVDLDDTDYCPPRRVILKAYAPLRVVDPLLWALHRPVDQEAA